MQNAHIFYGDDKIEFYISRKKVKNINLKVTPEAKIIVSAGTTVPLDYIKEFIKRKAAWIIKNVKYFDEFKPSIIEKKYESGESHRYLGRQYRLKVTQSHNIEVKLSKGYISLNIIDVNNIKLKKKILDNWYKQKARIKFKDIFEKIFPLIQKYEIERPKLTIRNMKTKWGSYSSKKHEIALNIDLIKSSKYCIEYVILHELIHLKYRNHDKNFHYFLTALMPDWKKRKEILDQEIIKEL